MTEQTNIEQRAREFLPTPCAYARVCDGAYDIRIGPEQPANRAGGYATPWAAMYDTPAVLAAIAAALRGAEQPSETDLHKHLLDLLGAKDHAHAAPLRPVTDEDVLAALDAFNTSRNYDGEVVGIAMRVALENDRKRLAGEGA